MAGFCDPAVKILIFATGHVRTNATDHDGKADGKSITEFRAVPMPLLS